MIHFKVWHLKEQKVSAISTLHNFKFFNFIFITINTVKRDAHPCEILTRVGRVETCRKVGGTDISVLLLFFFFPVVFTKKQDERGALSYHITSASKDGQQSFDDTLETPMQVLFE